MNNNNNYVNEGTENTGLVVGSLNGVAGQSALTWRRRVTTTSKPIPGQLIADAGLVFRLCRQRHC
jgi:hypothetical protein